MTKGLGHSLNACPGAFFFFWEHRQSLIIYSHSVLHSVAFDELRKVLSVELNINTVQDVTIACQEISTRLFYFVGQIIKGREHNELMVGVSASQNLRFGGFESGLPMRRSGNLTYGMK